MCQTKQNFVQNNSQKFLKIKQNLAKGSFLNSCGLKQKKICQAKQKRNSKMPRHIVADWQNFV